MRMMNRLTKQTTTAEHTSEASGLAKCRRITNDMHVYQTIRSTTKGPGLVSECQKTTDRTPD